MFNHVTDSLGPPPRPEADLPELKEGKVRLWAGRGTQGVSHVVEHAGRIKWIMFMREIVYREMKFQVPEGQGRGAAVHVDHLDKGKIHIDVLICF